MTDVRDARDCFTKEQQRLLDELLSRRDRQLVELENRLAALEHAAAQAPPEAGDPVAAGFEAYRRRAHAIEERRERKELGP